MTNYAEVTKTFGDALMDLMRTHHKLVLEDNVSDIISDIDKAVAIFEEVKDKLSAPSRTLNEIEEDLINAVDDEVWYDAILKVDRSYEIIEDPDYAFSSVTEFLDACRYCDVDPFDVSTSYGMLVLSEFYDSTFFLVDGVCDCVEIFFERNDMTQELLNNVCNYGDVSDDALLLIEEWRKAKAYEERESNVGQRLLEDWEK